MQIFPFPDFCDFVKKTPACMMFCVFLYLWHNLIQSVDLLLWLYIGYPNQVFLYGYPAIGFSLAGVEEPELTFITAWPHKYPKLLSQIRY